MSGPFLTGVPAAALAWAGPWLCFILPVSTLSFLLAAPHAWDAALLWTLPVWLCVAADYFSPSDRSAPPADGVEWLLDARLYALFGLQITNIALLLDAASRLAFATPGEVAASAANVVALRILVGTTSCCSGIALAHELLHRRLRSMRWMGRIVLWTVCYDHFAYEHGRGHHRLASTLDDPATARFGESFSDFFRRSARGQWLRAWRSETFRLRKLSGPARWLRHRVLQGFIVQLALLAGIAAQFGLLALALFLYQAWVAVRLLEAVNYVQHFGLVRAGSRFGAADAWATDSWFTLHCFLGLSRHADHHIHTGRPCHRLRHLGESPKLPAGYFVMALMVRLRNDYYLQQAARELRATGLGPFQPGRRIDEAAAGGEERLHFKFAHGIVFADGSFKVRGADS